MNTRYYTSLFNYIYHHESKSLEQVVRQVTEAGFGIELWPYFFSLDPYRPALQTRSLAIEQGFDDLFDIAHLARLETAVSGLATSWHSRGAGEKPLKISTFEEHAQQIDTAAAIGSSIISVHDIGESVTNTQVSDDVGIAERVVEYARFRGVSLALETGNFEACRKATDLLPELKICLDPAYIFSMSDISLDDYISEFDRKICYLHLYDVSATGGHYPPGSGDVPEKDWLLLLRWMQDTEFQGPVVFEVHPLPECDGQSAIGTVIGSRNYLETLSNTL